MISVFSLKAWHMWCWFLVPGKVIAIHIEGWWCLDWNSSILMCSRGKNEVPSDRHWCGTSSHFHLLFSPRLLPANLEFLNVDYKWSFDERAFWVSDNHIIILLKSVLIVSKLLVTVSSPGDLGGGGVWNTLSLKVGLCSRGRVTDRDHLCISLCKVASALEEVGPVKLISCKY